MNEVLCGVYFRGKGEKIIHDSDNPTSFNAFVLLQCYYTAHIIFTNMKPHGHRRTLIDFFVPYTNVKKKYIQ